jgi:hypothetical protein
VTLISGSRPYPLGGRRYDHLSSAACRNRNQRPNRLNLSERITPNAQLGEGENMARFIRRSILRGFLFVVFCTFLVCLPAQMVLAQRPVAPTRTHCSDCPAASFPATSDSLTDFVSIHSHVPKPRCASSGSTRQDYSFPSSTADSPASASRHSL